MTTATSTTPSPIAASDDLAWLDEVLGFAPIGARPAKRPVAFYLARPSASEVRLLVPTRPRRAAVAALRRSDDDRSFATRAAGLAGQGLALAGRLSLAPGAVVPVVRFDLLAELERALGEPELVAAVTLGPRRRNRKPVLKLLTPAGRTVGFAKVGWSPLTTGLVANETARLRAVEGRLPVGVEAPVVLASRPWGSGLVTVTSPLVGPAWPRRRHRAALPIDQVALAIAAAGPAESVPAGRLALLDEWEAAGLDRSVDLDRLRRRHGDTVLRTGLWHGDLTPWNVAALGPRTLAIWDWEFAAEGRPIGFDLLHHHFEANRRAKTGSNRRGLLAVVRDHATVLDRLDLDRAQRQAIVDLYLAELAARELRLSGQRWSGGTVAELGPEVVSLLRTRLA